MIELGPQKELDMAAAIIMKRKDARQKKKKIYLISIQGLYIWKLQSMASALI